MVKEQLSFVADAILALCERDPLAPAYSEATFEVKLKRARKRDPFWVQVGKGSPYDPLAESEVRGILAGAKLTPSQSDVLALRMEGFSLEEIGDKRGHSRQAALNILRQASKKIHRALDDYPYVGLAEVYRSESRRGRVVSNLKHRITSPPRIA
ncbi:MAG: hypothetical protein ACOYON_07135 [Fimbriimonas sp.]